MDETIRKYALQNAVFYKGKASQGAVIGKVIAENPDLKSDMKSLARQVGKAIGEVNALSAKDQQKELEQLAPELLEKKEKEERDIFSSLKLEDKPYTTLFPTGPEKYPHLGHAKSAYINYLLAQRSGGKYYLRFDDTNPKLVEKRYYDIIKRDLEWLGITFDEVIYASDHLEEHYKHCETLIDKGLAYVDFSSAEDIRKSRETGEPTKYRDLAPEKHREAWESLPQQEEGSAVVRLKIDLKHKNTTMRDPAIFRIIKAPHPRTGDKYTVWPAYDFQTAVMDSHSRIEFRLRSKEFEMRAELQRWIQDRLSLPLTKTYEFARFNMEGVASSGRKIREGIESGELVGWDDPTLTTLAALRRRGFTPEAIRNFVQSTGITKSESTLTWDDLIVQNKRVLDRDADRFFFVQDPQEITMKGAPKQEVKLRRHPDDKERGTRDFMTSSSFYLTKQDISSIEEGKLYRLMDCLNFRKEGDSFAFVSADVEDYKKEGEHIMHWLPVQDDLVKTEIMMPDKSVITGLAEPGVSSIAEGTVIQFERFGFCRLDAKENGILKFWYTHK